MPRQSRRTSDQDPGLRRTYHSKFDRAIVAMTLLVKICGLKTPEALDAALDGGADLVGFVFFPPSPRHLDDDVARALGRRVADRAGKVALTVDADDALLARIVEVLEPDL